MILTVSGVRHSITPDITYNTQIAHTIAIIRVYQSNLKCNFKKYLLRCNLPRGCSPIRVDLQSSSLPLGNAMIDRYIHITFSTN